MHQCNWSTINIYSKQASIGTFKNKHKTSKCLIRTEGSDDILLLHSITHSTFYHALSCAQYNSKMSNGSCTTILGNSKYNHCIMVLKIK